MGTLVSFLLLFLSYQKHLREEGVIWLMLPDHSLLLSSQLELQQELGMGFPGLNSASLVLCSGTTSLQIVLSTVGWTFPHHLRQSPTTRPQIDLI